MFELRRDVLGFLTRSASEYGDVAELRLFGRKGYLVSDPALVEEILVNQSARFSKPSGREPTGTTQSMFGQQYLDSDGDFWTRHRRTTQPAFHHQELERYATLIVDGSAAMLAEWRDGEVRDVHRDLTAFTLRVVTRAMLSVDVGANALPIAEALDVVMAEIAQRVINPFALPLAVPLPHHVRFRRAIDRLDRFIGAQIAQRPAGHEGDDLFGMLLRARREQDAAMPEEQWRYELMTFVAAGYETTTLALTWALYLLARDPDVETRLWAELSRTLGDRRPQVSDLGELRYVEAIVKETLRLYPPAWLLGARIATADCELGPYVVPAGTVLLISPWVIHHDARWHANADRFDPDRWAHTGSARPFTYFPFGGGPRHCPGYSFAMLEATLSLATIAQSVRLRLAHSRRVHTTTAVTLRPRGGMPMRVERRDPNAAAVSA